MKAINGTVGVNTFGVPSQNLAIDFSVGIGRDGGVGLPLDQVGANRASLGAWQNRNLYSSSLMRSNDGVRVYFDEARIRGHEAAKNVLSHGFNLELVD